MTFEALRCFCAVAEEGSFRAAARRLARSQPAVSQQIRALEDELGQRLLDRRRHVLTPAGELLYERGRRVVHDVAGIAREVADLAERPDVELRVGTSDTVALYMLPACVRAFTRRNPNTRLVIVNRSSLALGDQVLRGELDMAVVTLPASKDAFESQELFVQEFAAVVPADHPLARKRRVNLRYLKSEPFLMLDAATRTGTALVRHFEKAGFEPQAVLDSGSFEVIKRYVSEGIGVSILPRAVVTGRDEGVACLDVPGLPALPIGAIWRRGGYMSRSARLFLELLQTPGILPEASPQ
ncbi:MAG: LysR family transcriptional regulator [Candidatus Hydrogenedentota bacterium]